MATKILTLKETIDLTGLSKSTIWRLVKKGNFALPIKMSQNRMGFDLDDLNDWLTACKRGQNWADVEAARAVKTQLQKTEPSINQRLAKVATYLANQVVKTIAPQLTAIERRLENLERQQRGSQFIGNSMRAFRSDDTRVDLPIVNSFVDLPTVKIIDANNSYGINNKRIQKK